MKVRCTESLKERAIPKYFFKVAGTGKEPICIYDAEQW